MKSRKYKIVNKRKKMLVRAADVLLDAAAVFRFIKHVPDVHLLSAASVRKILIVRLAYIGDVVMTLPVVEPLAKAFPGAEMDFITSRSSMPLLENHPFLHHVEPFNAPWFFDRRTADDTGTLVRRIRSGQYDLGIDFRGDIRNIINCLYRPGIRYRMSYTSGGGGALLTHPVQWEILKHKVDYHLDLLRRSGISASYSHPKIHLTEPEIEKARAFMNRLPGCRNQAPVVIHPGARLPLKKWPAKRFIEFIERMERNGLGPVVLVDAEETDETRHIADTAPVAANLAGVLSIREMAAFLSLCRAVVCHDSGPMHIAAAVGTRVIALFGPSRPVETHPCGAGHVVIEAPCANKEDCDENVCLVSGEEGCMARIPVDRVMREARRMLQHEDENHSK